MTAEQLADKVHWEGGVYAALEYGLRSEDIEDPELASLWRRMEELHDELTSGPLADLRLGVLHGRLAPDQKEQTMRAFAAGKLARVFLSGEAELLEEITRRMRIVGEA